MANRLCILAKGDAFEQLHTMVGLVSTAVSMGWECHVFATYGVLYRYVHGTMSEAPVRMATEEVAAAYRKGIDHGKIPDLDELFAEARELAGAKLRVHGCTTSVKLLQLDAELLQKCDSLMGHASFLALVGDGQLVVT
jgi:peroxiredoxin family protein